MKKLLVRSAEEWKQTLATADAIYRICGMGSDGMSDIPERYPVVILLVPVCANCPPDLYFVYLSDFEQ